MKVMQMKGEVCVLRVMVWCLCAVAVCGCDSPEYRDSSLSVSCGEGTFVEVEGEAFCIYEGPITETGFECPPEVPHQMEFEGRGVCAQNSMPEEEALERAVADAGLAEELPVGPMGKVDILWVIDNSGSMCEEQAQIRAQAEAFVGELVAAGLDFQLAVVTTDMVDPSQSGRFQNQAQASDVSLTCTIEIDISQCDVDEPPSLILRSSDYLRDGEVDSASLSRDFGCSATVGTDGDGFEAGLEAMRSALGDELSEGFNAGFLRDDAVLAVVFVSDENDCSDGGVLDKTTGEICEWERDRLIPTSEYVDFLLGLKGGDASRIVVGGIIAPDDGVRYDFGETVVPSCFSDVGGDAFAGYRYAEVSDAFEQGALDNICAPPYDNFLSELSGRLIVPAALGR